MPTCSLNTREEEECSNSGPKSCLDKLPMFHRLTVTIFLDVYRNLKIQKHVRYAEYKLVIISIALQLHPLEPFYELLPLELLRINYKSWKRYKLAH